MRLSEGMADSISRSIDGNVKLVHFFREYDQENKKTQEMVEQQLENFLIDLDMYEEQPFQHSRFFHFDPIVKYFFIRAKRPSPMP